MGRRRRKAKSQKAAKVAKRQPPIIVQNFMIQSPSTDERKNPGWMKTKISSMAFYVAVFVALFGNNVIFRSISTIEEFVRHTSPDLADPLTVELVSPANGSVFHVGDRVTLKGRASSRNSRITSVKFYANAQLIGEDTSADENRNYSDRLSARSIPGVTGNGPDFENQSGLT